MGTQNRRFGDTGNLTCLEVQREGLQDRLDAGKLIHKRRMLGQFATPYPLAKEMVLYGLSMLCTPDIRFLEPAMGTGAIYSALLSEAESIRTIRATGFEIDQDYFNAAAQIWKNNDIELYHGDFTNFKPKNPEINLLVGNPPYVRHHLIPQKDKNRMKSQTKKETAITLSGLSGLYCYFILLAHKWLEPGAICGWLIPSEFMDVNYGECLKEYLLNKVHLLRIQRYNPKECQFSDALVSSSVVWFKNERLPEDYEVEISYGGSHFKPDLLRMVKKSALAAERKWSRFPKLEVRSYKSANAAQDAEDTQLKQFFDIKRGLATGDNKFFILSQQKALRSGIEREFLTPILPSPRKLNTDEILREENGDPTVDERLYLLNCTLMEEEIITKSPSLWMYLLSGIGSTSKKYLCSSRKKWYMQEQRKPAPFMCSYMGRGSHSGSTPFRFLLNHSDAIATNAYLMLYPKDSLTSKLRKNPDLLYEIWNVLRTITRNEIECEGRVYGGGLTKIEPKELGNVSCPALLKLLR